MTSDAADSQGGDGGQVVTCNISVNHLGDLYAIDAVFSIWTDTYLPWINGRNIHRASNTASNFRYLMCQRSQGPVQDPDAACPLHIAPQPVLDVSVVTTTERITDTSSRLQRTNLNEWMQAISFYTCMSRGVACKFSSPTLTGLF